MASAETANATWPSNTPYNSTRGEWDCCCSADFDFPGACTTQACGEVDCNTPNPVGCVDCVGGDCGHASSYIGDGSCDDGQWGVDFTCALFNYDDGDCEAPPEQVQTCRPRAVAECRRRTLRDGDDGIEGEARHHVDDGRLDDDDLNNAAGDRQLQARVVGGTEVCPSFAYAGFLVGIMDGEYQTTAETTTMFCGGTLYGRRHVITAAHCVCLKSNGGFAPGQSVGLAVEVHRHDVRKPLCEECAARIAVVGVHCHPDYDPDTLDSDLAVLVLAEDVPPQYEVDDVVLDRLGTFEANGSALIVTGWGAINSDQNDPVYPNTTMAVEVAAIATSECTSGAWGYESNDITDNMFCAGYRRGTPQDACQASACA